MSYLQRIEEHKNLNVFLEVYIKELLQKAKETDDKISKNEASQLAGLVFRTKYLFCYQEHEVSEGSQILKDYESFFKSTALQKLLDEDAILIGKQNCDEFGMGSSNENSLYDPPLNVLDLNRVSSGSSRGYAVAVQTNLCLASLSIDTGGSVDNQQHFVEW